MKKLILTILMVQCIVLFSFSQWNYNGALYAPITNNNEGDLNIQSPNGGLRIFDHGISNFLQVGGRGLGYSKGFMFKSTTNNTADAQFTLSVTDGVTQQDRMVINKYGNVGIGTTAPLAQLHVTNSIMASNPIYSGINVRMDGTTGEPKIKFSRDGDGNRMHFSNAFIGQFWDASLSSYSLGIGTGFSSTGDQNANNTVITIPLNGNVGIGTTNPQSLLAVAGTITAKEIKVTLNGWADYVFENTYNLPPLSQVESFIKENKHLPEIPSAKEVEKNGVNLGEMDALLLKKIEELTLYMIEMKKEVEGLKKENEILRSK